MHVSLIAKTVPFDGSITPEGFVAYVARISNPSNQMNNESAPKLLKYLIDNEHWSPFEHCYMTVAISTSRAIAQQILRHRSFTFQEFSQRYAEALDFELYEARRQDVKNRQNSIDDMEEPDKAWFEQAQRHIWQEAFGLYKTAIDKCGIAKEQARFLLPLNTATKIYMTGSVRSWIHYIKLRADKATQKEHQDIAREIKVIFGEQYPNIYKAVWDD